MEVASSQRSYSAMKVIAALPKVGEASSDLRKSISHATLVR